MVRLYCTEGEGNLKKMLSRLHNDFGVRGATVFRGVAGFGASGEPWELMKHFELTAEFIVKKAIDLKGK